MRIKDYLQRLELGPILYAVFIAGAIGLIAVALAVRLW